MNSFFNSIIDWFKSFFGIKPENKNNADLKTDFFDTSNLSLTSILAERLTTLTISDNTINILGDSARSKYISRFVKWFNDTKLSSIAQVCLGTGDCFVRPNTDGKRIGIDIVPNENFIIVESTGDFISSMIVKCDEFVKNNETYERWEYLKLNVDMNGIPYESITQVAFKNGKQIPIASVQQWAGLKDNQLIPNVDRLLGGRFKCPKLNRKDVNSANGVPITYGNEYIVEQAKASYKRFNEEFDDSKKYLFADKRVFKTKKVKNADGTVSEVNMLPKGKENVIMTVNGSTQVDGSPLLHEFNPSIRQTELSAGIQENLRMLELACGFDSGILSQSNFSYENLDATRKSVQNTFAFITNFRKVLEDGISDLLYAVNVICNFNQLTPIGNYNVTFDWSDSYAENFTERFNELLQAHSIGAVSTAEIRAWVQNEPLDVAEETIENMDIEEITE